MGAQPPDDPPRVHRFEVDGQEFAVVSLPATPALPDALSPAEREVAQLLLEGRSNREIAAARGTSERTVANQVASIFRRCGVASRAELAAALALPE